MILTHALEDICRFQIAPWWVHFHQVLHLGTWNKNTYCRVWIDASYCLSKSLANHAVSPSCEPFPLFEDTLGYWFDDVTLKSFEGWIVQWCSMFSLGSFASPRHFCQELDLHVRQDSRSSTDKKSCSFMAMCKMTWRWSHSSHSSHSSRILKSGLHDGAGDAWGSVWCKEVRIAIVCRVVWHC